MSSALDGNGVFEEGAREISDSYFAGACITPLSGASGLPSTDFAINQNGLFEAARRFSEFVRMIGEHQFTGYEVGEDGKSVLWFQKHSIYSSRINLFRGIADEIRHEAPQAGWSNEWLLEMDFKPFAPSESSLFKISAYADWFAQFDRCQFHSPEIDNDDQYLWHIAYGATDGSGNIVADGVPGWRYGRLFESWSGGATTSWHLNYRDCEGDPTCIENNRKFYKSCQIYPKPYEIESAVTVTSGGEEYVKVTLTTRLQNTSLETDGAPDTISRDVGTWDFATVGSEPFRTDENALRLYLLMVAHEGNAPPIMGDNALNSAVHTTYDNVFGAIIPFFQFTKLIPHPWTDDNDNADSKDSPLWHDVFPQMDVYLRAMCEGFVDERSTKLKNNCVVAGTCTDEGLDLFDYTYENLLYDAFSGANFTPLASEATEFTDEIDTRDDKPIAFGPLPTLPSAAECFNQFASAIDLLDKVRIMFPFEFEYRTITYANSVNIASGTCGGPVGCGAGLGYVVYQGTGPQALTLTNDTGWVTSYAEISAATGAGFGVEYCNALGDYDLATTRVTVQYRFSARDPDWVNAVPGEWRDMLNWRMGSMFCQWDYTARHRWITPDDSSTACNGALAFACDFETVYDFTAAGTSSCVFLVNGAVDFGPVAPQSVFAAAWNGVDVCSYSSQIARYLLPLDGRTVYLQVPLRDGDAT